jgi:hypothetical protein
VWRDELDRYKFAPLASRTIDKDPGGLMLHEREQFVTEVEFRIIVTALAELRCSRCELRYRDHTDADHLFFDDPADTRIEDRN